MTKEKLEKKTITTEVKQTQVQVIAQYVKDFSFENPNAPESLQASNVRPEMDVNMTIDGIKINDDNNPDLYESTITLKVKSTRDGDTMFITEIVYAALVSLKNVPQEFIRPILYVEVPQMLFPFARHMVSNAVTSGGFPPLLLNPIDFKSMYDNSQKLDKEAISA